MSPTAFFRSFGSLVLVAWFITASNALVAGKPAEAPESESQVVSSPKPKTFRELVSQSGTLNLGGGSSETTDSASSEDSVPDGLRQFFKEEKATEFRMSDETAEASVSGDASESEPPADTPDTDTPDDDEDAPETQDRKVGVRALAKLPSIQGISLNQPVAPGLLPRDYAAEAWAANGEEFHGRGHRRQQGYEALVSWEAPWIGYRPLYFEDVWLERHGLDYGCCQTLVSAAKFYGRLPLVPYMVGANPCCECVYSYGRGRPGDCTPHFFTCPKKSVCGAVLQAASVGGLVWLTP